MSNNEAFDRWFIPSLIAIVALAIIGTTTYVNLRQIETEKEEVEIIQSQKSERGHWIWGHFDDVVQEGAKAIKEKNE